MVQITIVSNPSVGRHRRSRCDQAKVWNFAVIRGTRYALWPNRVFRLDVKEGEEREHFGLIPLGLADKREVATDGGVVPVDVAG